MIKKYIYSILIGVFGLLFLAGCDTEVAIPEEGDLEPILFSANLPEAVVENSSRLRSTGFSNGDKVGIVAAKASVTTPLPTDWTTDLYMNHVVGTVGDPTWVHADPDPEYPITLNPTRYWPFNPDEYLGFAAYSPVPGSGGGDSRVTRANMELTVNGQTNNYFPDLLFTGRIGNYNKIDKRVLFDFKHAMAKLAVNVTVVDQNDKPLLTGQHPVNQLEISSLVVQTQAHQAIFDLMSSKWTSIETVADFQTAYTGETLLTLPYSNVETSTWYLLPSTSTVNTVDMTRIDFKVRDKNIDEEYGGEYSLADFKQASGEPVKLEMGKTTVLNIKIKYVLIPVPDPEIILEGQLVEWDYKGESTVTIE